MEQQFNNFASVLSWIASEFQLLVNTLQRSIIGQLIIFLGILALLVSTILAFRGGE